AVCKRFLKTAQYRTIPAAIVPGLGVPWLDSDETAVILGGTIIKASSLMNIAALRQSFNVAGDEVERGVIIRDCSGIVPLPVMGAAAAYMGVRIRRIEFDGAVVVGEGAVDLAARSQRTSAVEEGDRAVRVERDRAVIVSNRTLDIALNCVEIAAGHMDRCAL